MRILKLDDLSSTKELGNTRHYFFDPNFEVIYHEIGPGISHPMHYHKVVKEVVLLVEGQLELMTLSNDGKNKTFSLDAISIIEFLPNEPHELYNSGDEIAKIVTVKYPPKTRDKIMV